jgi:hypothetical protein
MTHYEVTFHGQGEQTYEVDADNRREAVEKATEEHPKNAPMVDSVVATEQH